MPERSSVKKVGRAAAYPALRLLDPRFADLLKRLDDTRKAVESEGAATREAIRGFEPMVESYAASSGESLAFVGTELRELLEHVRAVTAMAAAAEAGLAPDAGSSPAPVEHAFAVRALARMEPPARILDVGGADRTLGMTLASLGFEVSGIDRRPYLHQHPGLRRIGGDLTGVDGTGEPFAAACCLSGLPVPVTKEPWAAKAKALEHLRSVISDTGVVVLGLPVGARVTHGRPHYDESGLDVLLDGWRVDERWYVTELLAGTWVRTESPEGRCLALVAAVPA